jgi:hypothetical protein
MTFRIVLTDEAWEAFNRLAAQNPTKHEKVRKTLGLMETDLRSKSLQTHQYESLKGPDNEKVYEAYVENRTPGAFRVFWYYGPGKGVITVFAITTHP